jgi:hypothetical protein
MCVIRKCLDKYLLLLDVFTGVDGSGYSAVAIQMEVLIAREARSKLELV